MRVPERTLLFATSNPNKVKEIEILLPKGYVIKSLIDLGFFEEIPETENTLEGNARLKADFLYNSLQMPCFSEDTGLEVDVLNGAPGVHTARYAGDQKNASDNIDKLLKALSGKENRRAQFRTIIAFKHKDGLETFEGISRGVILSERKGIEGFGYAPIFQPIGQHLTFAEMNKEQKNQHSHRARAFKKFLDYLEKQH